MFGIGGTELLIIAVLAVLLLGPDRIPEVARKAGRIFADFKRYQESIESVVKAEWEAGAKPAEGETAGGSGKAKDRVLHHAQPSTFVDDEEDEEEEE
mgnify:CR=1 FL=1